MPWLGSEVVVQKATEARLGLLHSRITWIGKFGLDSGLFKVLFGACETGSSSSRICGAIAIVMEARKRLTIWPMNSPSESNRGLALSNF
jgi:hypothetical protein